MFNNEQKNRNYSDIPAKERERIIKKSIKEANQEQLELVREFDRKFKHAN